MNPRQPLLCLLRMNATLTSVLSLTSTLNQLRNLAAVATSRLLSSYGERRKMGRWVGGGRSGAGPAAVRSSSKPMRGAGGQAETAWTHVDIGHPCPALNGAGQ